MQVTARCCGVINPMNHPNGERVSRSSRCDRVDSGAFWAPPRSLRSSAAVSYSLLDSDGNLVGSGVTTAQAVATSKMGSHAVEWAL